MLILILFHARAAIIPIATLAYCRDDMRSSPDILLSPLTYAIISSPPAARDIVYYFLMSFRHSRSLFFRYASAIVLLPLLIIFAKDEKEKESKKSGASDRKLAAAYALYRKDAHMRVSPAHLIYGGKHVDVDAAIRAIRRGYYFAVHHQHPFSSSTRAQPPRPRSRFFFFFFTHAIVAAHSPRHLSAARSHERRVRHIRCWRTPAAQAR